MVLVGASFDAARGLFFFFFFFLVCLFRSCGLLRTAVSWHSSQVRRPSLHGPPGVLDAFFGLSFSWPLVWCPCRAFMAMYSVTPLTHRCCCVVSQYDQPEEMQLVPMIPGTVDRNSIL